MRTGGEKRKPKNRLKKPGFLEEDVLLPEVVRLRWVVEEEVFFLAGIVLLHLYNGR